MFSGELGAVDLDGAVWRSSNTGGTVRSDGGGLYLVGILDLDLSERLGCSKLGGGADG